ncbi:hypothetical protein A8A01_10040 [Ewingella americana]|nr:hypothetical protein A8A01_10040 [Ewingella americana]
MRRLIGIRPDCLVPPDGFDPKFAPSRSGKGGEGMKHYVEKVQEPEFAAIGRGYTFASHQQEVGTGYFDKVTTIIQGGRSSVTALTGSTEEQQFSSTSH